MPPAFERTRPGGEPSDPPPTRRAGGHPTAGWLLRHGAGALALVASLGLHFAVMLVFAFRWDRAAAVTAFPFWAWAAVGLALALPGAALVGRRIALVPAAIWLVSAFCCSDETRGLVRLMTTPGTGTAAAPAAARPADGALAPDPPAAAGDSRRLRLVSLNCRRQAAPLEAIEPLGPDLVLLQEAPHFQTVQELSRRLFGSEGWLYYGVDTAIVNRGRLRLADPIHGAGWVQATLLMPDAPPIEILNLHLIRPVVRVDLWSVDAWRAHFYNRRARDLQVRELVGRLLATAGNRPSVVAGDFNAPPVDPVFRRLAPHFVDTYRVAGVGWCNNRALHEVSDFPVARTDQVWVTREFRTLAHRVVDTGTSVNHRIVVVDLAIDEIPRETPAR